MNHANYNLQNDVDLIKVLRRLYIIKSHLLINKKNFQPTG